MPSFSSKCPCDIEMEKEVSKKVHNDLKQQVTKLKQKLKQQLEDNKTDILWEMGWDQKLFRKKKAQVKEQLRCRTINQFRYDETWPSEAEAMLSICKESSTCLDCDGPKIWYCEKQQGQLQSSTSKDCRVDEVISTKELRVNERKFFIKQYDGVTAKDKVRMEASFLTTLREMEEMKRQSGQTVNDGWENIVRPFVLIEDSLNDFMFSISKLYEGDAFDVFGEKPLSFCATHAALYYDLGAALKYLHDYGFYHGDVKLENTVYWLDFQMRAHFAVADLETANCIGVPCKGGTPNYCSPQHLIDKKKYDPHMDSWAFAVTIINAWLGRPLLISLLCNEIMCIGKHGICTKCNLAFLDIKGSVDRSLCGCPEFHDINQPRLEKLIDAIENEIFSDVTASSVAGMSIPLDSYRCTVNKTLKSMLSLNPATRSGLASFCPIR